MFHVAPITLMPPLLGPISIVCVALVLLVASLNDIASRTLPNWACLTIAGFGLAMRAADASLLASLGVALLVFLVLAQCWRQGWLGGGDVKLLAACTLVVPPGQVLHLILATALAGGALALVYLVLRRVDPGRTLASRRGAAGAGRPAGLVARVWRIECWRISRRGSLPYGCAIAVAVMVVLLSPGSSYGG